VNFSDLQISIQSSIYQGMIGDCKTEASRKPIPLNERVAADLWWWKETTKCADSDDWIFASSRNRGQKSFWANTILQKVIGPASKAGIRKKIGWHTFRHTYSTLLIANGENVKVVQDLMRHASSRLTLEIYSQAQIAAKRQAQKRLVQALFPDEVERFPPVIQGQAAADYR
jgi:site-specific recombinase XerD